MVTAGRIESQRNPDVWRHVEDRSVNMSAKDPNDSVRLSVDAHLSANDRRIRTETPLPEAVTQQDHSIAARAIFGRCEGTPECHLCVKHREVLDVRLNR